MSLKIGDAIKMYRNTKVNQFLGISESKNMYGSSASFLNSNSAQPAQETWTKQPVIPSSKTSFVPESSAWINRSADEQLTMLQKYRFSSHE